MEKEQTHQTGLIIAAFGCIWGFLEAITFGGLLHSHWSVLFPYHLCPCFMMTAVFGSFVMGTALAIYRKPGMLLPIGLVAAAFCWLGIPFLPCPARSSYYGSIISSATAAIIGSLSLALVVRLLMKKLDGNIRARIGAGALSAVLAATFFILATSYGLDKPICADLGYARPLPDFLGIGGIVWVVCAGILFPLGYLTGDKVKFWLASKTEKISSLSYVGPIATIVLCCGVGVVAFTAGASITSQREWKIN